MLPLWQHPIRLLKWCCPVVNHIFPSVWRSHHHSEDGSSVVTFSLSLSRASWNKFYVLVQLLYMLVWLSLPWRDFISLSDIIRICGHVMDHVITLWWSRESWYDFSLSWLKFSSWCDFVGVSLILYLDVINWILVWFFFALANFSS